MCLGIKNRKVPVHSPLEEEGRAMINGKTTMSVTMNERRFEGVPMGDQENTVILIR